MNRIIIFLFTSLVGFYANAATQLTCSSQGLFGLSVQNFVFSSNIEESTSVYFEVIFQSFFNGAAPKIASRANLTVYYVKPSENDFYVELADGATLTFSLSDGSTMWTGAFTHPQNRGRVLALKNCYLL